MLHGLFNKFLSDKRDDLRYIFQGKRGKRALAIMLKDLRFFDELHTDEDIALHNYAIRLLEQTGIYQDIAKDDPYGRAYEIAEKVLALPVDYSKEEEDEGF